MFLLALAHSATAATLPYVNQFSGTEGQGAPANLFAEAQGSWSLNAGALQYSRTDNSTSFTGGYALEDFDDLLDGTDFTISTKVSWNITSTNLTSTGDSTVGIGAFGSSTSPPANQILADWTIHSAGGASGGNTGRLRLLKQGTDTTFDVGVKNLLDPETSTADFDPTAGEQYTLHLSGVIADGKLKLTFSIFDAGGVLKAGLTAEDNIVGPGGINYTGDYFGLRARAAANGGLWSAHFDELTVSVPEPSAMVLLAIGTVLPLMRRRAGRSSPTGSRP